MLFQKKRPLSKGILMSSVCVFISLNCNVSNIFNPPPKQTSIPPITIVSPTEGTEFNLLNKNKIVIQYDPKVVTVPLERKFSMNEGQSWITMIAQPVGDDGPPTDTKDPQYYVLTWKPSENGDTIPVAEKEIWIKINGYDNTKRFFHIQKKIMMK